MIKFPLSNEKYPRFWKPHCKDDKRIIVLLNENKLVVYYQNKKDETYSFSHVVFPAEDIRKWICDFGNVGKFYSEVDLSLEEFALMLK